MGFSAEDGPPLDLSTTVDIDKEGQLVLMRYCGYPVSLDTKEKQYSEPSGDGLVYVP